MLSLFLFCHSHIARNAPLYGVLFLEERCCPLSWILVFNPTWALSKVLIYHLSVFQQTLIARRVSIPRRCTYLIYHTTPYYTTLHPKMQAYPIHLLLLTPRHTTAQRRRRAVESMLAEIRDAVRDVLDLAVAVVATRV